MKDELVGTIMTKFVGLGVQTYSYLIDGISEDIHGKATKSVP